jgi:hypothetical protein
MFSSKCSKFIFRNLLTKKKDICLDVEILTNKEIIIRENKGKN